ncbi:MAG: DMT family transporter [Dyella sp.]
MTTSPRQSALATFSLIVVTAVWGSTFFLIKEVVGRMPVADMLAVRFAIAALLMVLLFARALTRLPLRQAGYALGLGLIYGIAQLLQTWGLARTSASVSGFVTGMYVVFTPLLSTLLLRQRLPGMTWLASALATLGLAVLALNGLTVGSGVWLTLASAALYAMHIVGLGQVSRAGEAFAMSTVQMLAIAAVCLIATLPHGPQLPPDRAAWGAVLYIAVAAGAGAMLVQTWAQIHLSASRAAIVMTLEPVFAAGFAVLVRQDALSWRLLLGGALVLAAMYLVELAPRRKVRALRDPSAEAMHHEV